MFLNAGRCGGRGFQVGLNRCAGYGRLLLLTIALLTVSVNKGNSQDSGKYLRIARITVDKTKLDQYLAALRAQMESALREERGVLGYSALQDKNRPEKITIFETYASREAYQSHIQTEHFKRYKANVADMVLELELTDVLPIAINSKEK